MLRRQNAALSKLCAGQGGSRSQGGKLVLSSFTVAQHNVPALRRAKNSLSSTRPRWKSDTHTQPTAKAPTFWTRTTIARPHQALADQP
ncbi:hypothetical protein PC118_g22648 [Phytophthora cactorum]|uniref:Uncharacterized protein n=1 Tax=Phytophthora cactorum TaxID=29920 RepID=A0A8T1EZ88_9STRA|nr:hypothetical protein PC118_g22648 [Phytophthora cactorum]